MYDNYNYPAGADTPDAPWNQPVIPEKDFDVEVTITLFKHETVTTDDYTPEFDDEDGRTYSNTENTDWGKAYKDSGCFTIPELLNELKTYVEADMQTCLPNSRRGAHLKLLLEACDGWNVMEVVYEER